MSRVALIPIRGFDGMTRLASALPPDQRRALSVALADIALSAVAGTEMEPLVLTSDPAVASWATGRGVGVIPDSGGGLSASVTATVSALTQSHWAILHADLPFVTAAALNVFLKAVDESGRALAPSIDGGTNAIAGNGSFRFSYGPGSFHRHLAMIPNAAVVSCPGLAVEIDTEMHLNAVMSRPLPSSLPL